MSTASEREIRDLDYALDRDGQTVRLRSITLGSNPPVYFECEPRAFVRRMRPDEITGSITQSHRFIIVSPTVIMDAGWPGPGTVATDRDSRIPKKGDKVIANGKTFNVEDASGIYVERRPLPD